MKRVRVSDLVAAGVLRVDDGNHGNDRPRPHEFVSSGVPFIRAADMTSGIVDFTGAGKINRPVGRNIDETVALTTELVSAIRDLLVGHALARGDESGWRARFHQGRDLRDELPDGPQDTWEPGER